MPLVSVIVPCYNEQATIRLLLDALVRQTYPRADMEVIIADGRSTDGTRQEIAAFQKGCPELAVRLVENEQRTIPAGLNRALEAAQGDIIIRLDAHSMPYPEYVERCVTALETRRGDNVGGIWEICPGGQGWTARSIATAAAHPLGVGDAHYRFTRQSQVVDTVPFGAFYKALIERIGSFDETLLSNEDYEFNTRIRIAGGTIWLDPEIRSKYFARANYSALARQYWRYGYWKARMLRRYPTSLRWRQAVPPLFVLGILVLGGLSVWFSAAGWLLLFGALSYILMLLVVGLQVALKDKDFSLLLGVPLAVAIMHIAWGSGFLWSMIRR